MRHFEAKIKEKGNSCILTPEYWGDDNTTVEYLEAFWGVHEADVEWHEIIEIKN